MAPRIRVLVGPCPQSLVPITNIVNTPATHRVSSDIFEGEIAVHIKGFTNEDDVARHSEYFQQENRQGITWSIQVAGRFLKPYSADDILFGNIFEGPLNLPWGSSAVLKFMQFIDPTLEHDLFSQARPWALSPLVSTMPHFAHKRIKSDGEGGINIVEGVNSRSSTGEDFTGQLYLASVEEIGSEGTSTTDTRLGVQQYSLDTLDGSVDINERAKRPADYQFETPDQRRSYFSSAKHRRAIKFGPEDVISIDFCYGFLEFTPTIALRLPGGLSFDLVRYWNGQPVTFVCCERGKEVGEPWGRVFWCVVIERVE